MLGLLNATVFQLRLYLMKRRQFDNLALRKRFRERYDIDIGMYSYGCFDQWRMPGPIRIGRYCSFANTVRSAPINHPLEALTTHPALYEKKFGVVDTDITWDEPLIVEDHVWVAHNVVILPSCKFNGRGAVIGAGAILTKNVDRYAVMLGNPTRKIRDRFEPELAAAIEESRWWELDTPELRRLVQSRGDMVNHPSVAGPRGLAPEPAGQRLAASG
ncbi:MAG: CatB-related O-acetyltransferase [Phenylobacterium sp.]|nr:CatB-related O-acetyltransferase [Phenylobacterium sp.]